MRYGARYAYAHIYVHMHISACTHVHTHIWAECINIHTVLEDTVYENYV